MTEQERLLSAVCDAPDDDAPRLVYADWCDDHGDPDRADFIRTQIALARSPNGPNAEALRSREAALLKSHGAEWAAPLAEFVLDSLADGPFQFRRGFVESIDSGSELLLEDGARLFDLAPVRELRLPDEESYRGLGKCKWLLRLRALDLTGSGLSKYFGLAKFIGSRYLANLTTLRLCGQDDNGHLDMAGVKALLASKHLGKLEELDLSGNWLNQFDPHTVATFLQAGNLPSLRALHFRGVGLEDADAEAIAATPWMARVKVLGLSRNSIGDRGARALLGSALAGIEQLDLRDNLDRAEEGAQPISAAVKQGLKERFGPRVLL